jgi:uncharacterized protein YjbI with pentapeptide repeats
MLDDAREETVSQTSNGEPDTKEAEALASALNHSAERVQTLWFSFLTFMLYLAIATGTTTHRMLFLEEPLNLPVLNIPLPLLGFYILTPIIFVVLHFYMLFYLVLLARTARTFEDALLRAFPEDGDARENFRMRIENTLFVQLLVGGRLERVGINAKLLSLMALITLALAPVALMLMFEVKFLPYHSEAITWLHRGMLALDLALVWTLWPGYRSGWGVRLRPKKSWWLVVPGALSAVALAYAVVVATFPDERIFVATLWLHGSPYWNPINWDPYSGKSDTPNWYALIAPVNTLNLRGKGLIDDAKLARIAENNEASTGAQRRVATLSLQWRDLTGADLSFTDVRHVDFSAAILNRANFNNAWAKQAVFAAAYLRGASLNGASLRGASFSFASLQGASLKEAELQGASFFVVALKGASLNGAKLQGALLDYTELQGVSLEGAQLQGTSLENNDFQGASLNRADLQGALLDYTELQGASLDFARLQGASLDHAHLQGASLDYTQLQGASLDHAHLQGASLDHAQLQGASFVDVCAWRADARQADWKDTRVALKGPKVNKVPICDWTAASFAELKKLIAKEVPEGNSRRSAMERIEQRLDPTKPLDGEDEIAKIWAAREREVPTLEAYEKNLTGQWREAGCAAEGAPHVLHAFVARLSGYTSPFRGRSEEAKALATAFLDEAHCAGAHGLSEADKATLNEIAAPAAPQAPKP